MVSIEGTKIYASVAQLVAASDLNPVQWWVRIPPEVLVRSTRSLSSNHEKDVVTLGETSYALVAQLAETIG